MMTVVWLEEAVIDLKVIGDFIAEERSRPRQIPLRFILRSGGPEESKITASWLFPDYLTSFLTLSRKTKSVFSPSCTPPANGRVVSPDFSLRHPELVEGDS
jgi:hypothetical protein